MRPRQLGPAPRQAAAGIEYLEKDEMPDLRFHLSKNTHCETAAANATPWVLRNQRARQSRHLKFGLA
ncbi:hypothetical protein [Leisingera sp. S232]|uniref:hypothetical protein n=1 Tax=Leisingera sp. S232 TaxID=3415132 RepID=UPI003C7C41C5